MMVKALKSRPGSIKNLPLVLSCALIVFLGLVAYINSIDGKFVWDDARLVKDNPAIKDLSGIKKSFTQNMGGYAGTRSVFYRPMQFVTYALDYRLWRLDSRGYHATNMLMHILAALGLFWLVNIIFQDQALSLMTSVLFVLSPLHTEAVTYIAGRADPLAAVFVLLCFVYYIKYVNSKNAVYFFIMLSCYALAILSRENSLILPLALLLYHHRSKKKVYIGPVAFLSVIAALYVLLRLTFLAPVAPMAASDTALFQRLPGCFAAMTGYARLLLFPAGLHMEYGSGIFSFADPKVLTGILIVAFLIVTAFVKRNSNWAVFFSISWFFIFLLPSSNLYPINAYMAEHWLYLPSAGFFILAASFMTQAYRNRRYRLMGILAILLVAASYCILTIRQNYYWRDPIRFYARTLEFSPDNVRLLNNLGTAYSDSGKDKEAISFFERAIRLDHNNPEAQYNLGNSYRLIGKKEKALSAFNRAVEINPRYAKAYNDAGSVFDGMDNGRKAMEYYEKAIDADPDYADGYYNLGNSYRMLGDIKKAEIYYKKAIEIDPGCSKAYNNLGFIYRDAKRYDEAAGLFRRAIDHDPLLVDAYNNLGIIYKNAGRLNEAVGCYRSAIKIKPDYAYAYSNLGVAYKGLGRIKEAIEAYEKAIELDPSYAAAYNNLAALYYDEKEYLLAVRYCDKAAGLGFKVSPEFLKLLEQFRK